MKWVGAEAVVETDTETVTKTRQKKTWRHPELDRKLRVQRTKKEVTLLESVPSSPKVLEKERTCITMEYVDGEPLKHSMDRIKDAAEAVSKMHDADVYHGDLTPNNILITENEAVIIDFGLGGKPARVEDKAVDLHILKTAINGLVPDTNTWKTFVEHYNPDERSAILAQLETVEKRGRYK